MISGAEAKAGFALAGRRVLVVDGDAQERRELARSLGEHGAQVDVAVTVAEGLARLSDAHYDVALVAMSQDDRSAHEIVTRAAELDDAPVTILVSSAATMASAVAAMQNGAADFLERPVHEAALLARIEKALEAVSMRRRIGALESTRPRFAPAAKGAGPMQAALALARKVASTPGSPALILGESGVGKEVLATYIHEWSQRRHGPMVRVNVAAIADTMIEAELFGSVKGAFTDAKNHRLGHLASADGGTLLLDEIGEFRIDHQPKLLRVLEERKFFAVGSDRERSADVRILAATNREPEEMMGRGLLRRDLFYRLGITIRIPPLRERPEEILSLASHFVRTFCADFGRPPMELSAGSEQLLLGHSWPGNVRELRNAIERAVMITEGDTLEAEAFDIVHQSGTRRATWIAAPVPDLSLTGARQPAIEQAERERIVEALRVSKGRRARAAVVLGISRSTLYEKLRRYGIG